MDSGPTLDVVDGFCEEDEDEEAEEMEEREREVWGRLFPLVDSYSKTGTYVVSHSFIVDPVIWGS